MQIVKLRKKIGIKLVLQDSFSLLKPFSNYDQIHNKNLVNLIFSILLNK